MKGEFERFKTKKYNKVLNIDSLKDALSGAKTYHNAKNEIFIFDIRNEGTGCCRKNEKS